MRRVIDLKAAVDALTEPRIVHLTQQHPQTGELQLLSVEHPALIDLLENGTGTSRGSAGGGGGGMPGPIDAGALETWGQIRDQVRAWLKQMRATWSDDLKADLRRWHAHHELALERGRIEDEAADYAERLVESWRARIEKKFDPDERREWTEPCPAIVHADQHSGRTRRCSARRMNIDGALTFAIALNVTRLEAECRSCGTKWEGKRELMMLRYETNLAEAEQLVQQATADAGRELASTGPITLP